MQREQFDTESHVLQLNQYIPEKLIDELVAKVEAPVLTNIIEQDYFGKQNSNELSLSGVMIGLAMSSSVSNEEAMSKGTEVAKQLIEAINKTISITNLQLRLLSLSKKVLVL